MTVGQSREAFASGPRSIIDAPPNRLLVVSPGQNGEETPLCRRKTRTWVKKASIVFSGKCSSSGKAQSQGAKKRNIGKTGTLAD